jgi:hypothetical protein
MTATKPTPQMLADDALRAAVTELPKLPWVAADFVGADCRIGDDHDGYPSVWGRLIAKDAAVERPGLFDDLRRTRERIRDSFREAGLLGDRYMYDRLITETELRELLEDIANER